MTSPFPIHYYTQNQSLPTDYNIEVEELTESNPLAPQPAGSQIQLKPHQLTLLQRCIDFETAPLYMKDFRAFAEIADPTDHVRTKVGILGDRVGSGKSYVLLALMATPPVAGSVEQDIQHRSFAYNTVTFSMRHKRSYLPVNILVIPHNLSTQWEDYIQKFSPNARYAMVTSKKRMDELTEKLKDNLAIKDLVVVTATFYNKFATHFIDADIQVRRVVFDEVDSLHIPGCKHIAARYYWLVTASYGNVLYPRGHSRWDAQAHRYIWCAQGITHSGFIKNLLLELYSSVPRELMRVLVVKNHEGYVERSVTLPPIYHHFVRCKTPISVRVLSGIVDRNIIEALNADDVQGAMAHISPNRKATEDNIIAILIDRYNAQLANLQVRQTMMEQLTFDTEQERAHEASRLARRQEDLERKIRMIRERVQGTQTCAICYEDIERKSVTQCCQNAFCFRCIHLWLQQKMSCPMCKAPMAPEALFVVDEAAAPIAPPPVTEDDTEQYDKYENLARILKRRARGSKILIFSNYDSSLESVQSILNAQCISFDQLKGNTHQLNAILQKYRTGPVDVLLVNSRFYGSGLNLENTSDIVMFHKFDSEIEKQVIGRAHRMGRQAPLNVWYLLHDNEGPMSP